MSRQPEIDISQGDSVLARYHRLAARLYNTPLMVHPDKALVIAKVLDKAARGGSVNADAARPSAAIDDEDDRRHKPYALTSSGVAIIPVQGTLVHRGSFLDALSGLTSYQRLGAQIDMAADDRDVRAILLDVDSPGGEASGLFDLADRIRAASASKPLWAIANEEAFSAAYAIASAAGRLYAPRSALTGSIGVIALHVDQSGKDAKQGLKYTAIYAGAHKADFSRHEPLSDDARGRVQSVVDDQYGLFVGAVARHRGMDEGAVRATEAQVYTAPEALELGLIDGVATMDEVVRRLETVSRDTSSAGGLITTQRSTMTTETNGAPAAENQPETVTLTQEELDRRLTVAREESAASASVSERERIAAILDHEAAANRSALARHLALHTDMSPEQAAAALEAAPVEAKGGGRSAFENHMDRLGNPQVGADAGDEGGDTEAAAVQRILNA